MMNPVLTNLPLSFRPADVVLPDTLFEGSADDLPVTVDVAPQAMTLIGDYLTPELTTVLVGGVHRASIAVPHFHALKRLAASLSGLITIVDPPEARQVTADWAARGLAQYETTTR